MSMQQEVLDAQFPYVTYRRGAAGAAVPVIRGTGIRIQTLVAASQVWKMTPARIAEEYELSVEQVESALEFYCAFADEVEAALYDERLAEQAYT